MKNYIKLYAREARTNEAAQVLAGIALFLTVLLTIFAIFIAKDGVSISAFTLPIVFGGMAVGHFIARPLINRHYNG